MPEPAFAALGSQKRVLEFRHPLLASDSGEILASLNTGAPLRLVCDVQARSLTREQLQDLLVKYEGAYDVIADGFPDVLPRDAVVVGGETCEVLSVSRIGGHTEISLGVLPPSTR